MTEDLANYSCVFEQVVPWGDMDAFAHVNNTKYAVYFESARIKYFEAIELMALHRDKNVGPILKTLTCNYKSPVVYPDTLDIGVRIPTTMSDRFSMEYIAKSHKQNRIVATAETIIVFFDYGKQQKALLPESLIERIKAFEKLDVIQS